LTFKEGANSGGLLDSPDRIRWPRPKSISLKGRINSWLRRPRTKEKPAGLSWRA
jgi:hypothetical protein